MTDLILFGVADPEEKTLRSAFATVIKGGDLKVLNGEVSSPEVSAARIAEGGAPLVAIGSKLKIDTAIELARALEQADPLITTMLIADPDLDTLKRALEVGIREVLDPKASSREAADALRRALGAGALRRSVYDERVVERLGRRVIVVISAKGGSGKTVVSSNLAAALAMNHPKDAVLVDLDLQFGDTATALLLTPEHSLSDAAGLLQDELDGATLKVFLSRHGPSGLFVLCAPDDPATGDAIRGDDVGRIIDALSSEFRFVVIDTDAGLNEYVLAALDRATDLVVLVDLDVPSVRGGRKLLHTLDRLGFGAARRHVVLNRADSKVGLEISEVAEVLGVPIDLAIPSTRQVPISFNEGRPVVTAYAKSPVAKRIAELAERFDEVTERRARR
jgi:pilus assembly protein CpaE